MYQMDNYDDLNKVWADNYKDVDNLSHDYLCYS